MGTTWSVTYVSEARPASVREAIESTLELVNASMSTYRPESEISQINAGTVNEPVSVSSAFADVLRAALYVGEKSDGAYDITVAPLVDLWGFGAGSEADWQRPSTEAVDEALAQVGQAGIEWDAANSTLIRRKPVRLDFSSIAKGYGVDRIAEALEALGIGDYLVEIGGEIRVAGLSPRGDTWRIAVEQPRAGRRGIAEALDVTDMAIATSGDYRNFMEVDGVRYSHMIDPRTGHPVSHDLVSVTVLHEQCMMADAWATALSVLGPEAALQVASDNDLSVYLMVRDGEAYERVLSPAFTAQFGTLAEE